MNRPLDRLLGSFGLEAHADFLDSLARPIVNLTLLTSPPSSLGSKFGGSPDLPPAFVWPQHALGPYRFLAQVRLEDLPDIPCGLPRKGLLSFFFQYDDLGECFWGDADYVRVYHFPDLASLTPREPPEAVALGGSLAIGLSASTDVPPWPWAEAARAAWPIAKDLRSAYDDLRWQLHPGLGYLLGYPFNTTLAYDPTPGPEWASLLTLGSHEDLQLCWHDFDWLVTFIEKVKLAAGDFAEVRSDAG